SETRVRGAHERTPGTRERHLFLRRERLAVKHEHVMLVEKISELARHGSVDATYVESVDHSAERRGHSMHLQESKLRSECRSMLRQPGLVGRLRNRHQRERRSTRPMSLHGSEQNREPA